MFVVRPFSKFNVFFCSIAVVVAAGVLCSAAIAQCNQWDDVGGGMNGVVNDFVEFEGDLIAVGGFTTAGGTAANRVARWDGQQWHAMGNGTNAAIRTVAVYNGDLVIGGQFTVADGLPANRVARWNGSQWLPMGVGFNDNVNALHVHDGDLIAGGRFTHTIDNVTLNYVSRWDGMNWVSMDDGFQPFQEFVPEINAITSADGKLIVGGSFGSTTQGMGVTGVARWYSDTQSWGSLSPTFVTGTHPTDRVHTLRMYGGYLFVGGEIWGFDIWQQVGNIARWDFESNFALPGLGGVAHPTFAIVLDFTEYDGKLIVAGNFDTAGGESANRLATWDGSNWSAFTTNPPVNASIGAVHVYNGDVYIGGTFFENEQNPLNNIGRFRVGTPEIVDQPSNQVVSEGATVTFTVQDNDTESEFQWRKDGVPLGDGGQVSGADTQTLVLSNVTQDDFGVYDVLVSNTCGSVASSPVALSVQSGGPQPSCQGDLNGDGVVNVSDLLLLLSNWGACPD